MLARLAIAVVLVAQSLFGWVCARSDDVSQSCSLVWTGACAAHAMNVPIGAEGFCGESSESCCAMSHESPCSAGDSNSGPPAERCPECRLLPPPTRGLPERQSLLSHLEPIWNAPAIERPYEWSWLDSPARAPFASAPFISPADSPDRPRLCIWTI